MPSPRQRPASYRRLRRLQELTAFRAKRRPQLSARRARAWTLSSLAALLLVILVLTVGRRYVLQKINIEANLRSHLIPLLEKELGEKIEVEKIESDYFSRVVLRKITVGREPHLPLGALLHIERITVHISATTLLRYRNDPLRAVSKVVVDAPQLFIERDVNGRLNLADLFTSERTEGTRWQGTVDIHKGRLYYRDLSWRGASGRHLLLDAREAEGRLAFDGTNPIRFALDVPQTYAGDDRTPLQRISLSGSADSDGDWFALDARLTDAPAPILTDWGFRQGEIAAHRGRLAGDLQLMWDRTYPKNQQFSNSGKLTLRNIDGIIASAKEPDTQRPLTVQNASGTIRFVEGTFETTDLTLTAFESPLKIVGEFAVAPQVFDLEISSSQFSAARFTRLARALAPNPELQKIQLLAEQVQGTVRLLGTAQEWKAEGDLSFSDAELRHTQHGEARFSSPRIEFETSNGNGTVQVDARLKARSARYVSHEFGRGQAAGNFQGELLWSTGKRAGAPQLQLHVTADSFDAETPQQGNWRTNDTDALIRWDGIRVGAQLRTQKLAGRHPELGVLGARRLLATANFSPQSADDLAVHLSAQSAVGSEARLGILRGWSWQSGPLESTLHQRGQQGQLLLEAASFRAREKSATTATASTTSTAPTAAQLGVLRANIDFASARGRTGFFARFNTSRAHLQSAEAGSWQLASLSGIAEGESTSARTRVQTDLDLRGFSGAQQQYGRWSGEAARVVAATTDINRAGWSGAFALGKTDLSQLRLGEFSPTLAERVRRVGTATGKARFSGLGAQKTPEIKGRFLLSQLTIVQENEEFPLREIDTTVALKENQLRLADLRAQSTFGPLNADLQSNLTTGDLKLSVVAPRVRVSGDDLNPYLAASGVRLIGNATGNLRVHTLDAQASRFQTTFDFTLPRAQLFAEQLGGATAPLRLADSHLRGTGELLFNTNDDWRFSGEGALFAAHMAHEDSEDTVPLRAAGFHATARGTLARTPDGIEPQLQGQTRIAQLLLPLAEGERFPVRDVNAQLFFRPGALQVASFEGDSGEGSRITGHALVRETKAAEPRSAVRGAVFLEQFDAERAQKMWTLLRPEESGSSQLPQLRGALFARADFDGSLQDGELEFQKIGLQAQLYRGQLAYKDALIPIDTAQLETDLQYPMRESFPLRKISVWSEGAHLLASGTFTPRDEATELALDARIDSLPLQHLFEIGGEPDTERAFDFASGLARGDFKISGTLEKPKLSGQAGIRLASAFGLEIEEAHGDLALSMDFASPADAPSPSFKLAVSNISGTAEGSRFSGTLAADSAANLWALDLKNEERIAIDRLIGAMHLQENQQLQLWQDLPLRGELAGNLHLEGPIQDSAGAVQPVLATGEIKLDTDLIRWRGQELGVLTADLQLQQGVLHARRFELVRANEKDEESAHIRIAGVLPTALETPNLDAQFSIENGRLSFVLEFLRELQHSLLERGQSVEYLQTVLEQLEKLPPSVEGYLDLDAQLEQSWRSPVVEVRSLHAGDVTFFTPSGERRRLPDASARFLYDSNDNGAITIQNAELRLPDEGSGLPGNGNENGNGRTNDDLLIRTLRPGRIVPNGELALTIEILNADLQQLAQWLPELRNAVGEPAIRGRLSDFVLQLAGTASSPSIVGSLQGENWVYRGYSLDRIRLSRFTIENDRLQVEPGALTVVKGDFQSAAAWGYLPWNWGGLVDNGNENENENANGEEIGVSLTRPVEIHLPVGRENIGTLAGVFVPQIVSAGAEEFVGEVVIGGSLSAPQITGQAQIRNGTFRFRPTLAELDAGVTNLTGTLTFEEGNLLRIGEGGLSGRLIPADKVEAGATGNIGTAVREERDQRRQESRPPTVGGTFNLNGQIALNLDPALWQEPLASFSAHRYDLEFRLRKGLYSTPSFSGAREIEVLALWKTGEGNARENQRLQWALSAEGNIAKRKKGESGRALAFTSLLLPPDFATDMTALLSAKAEEFSSAALLASLSGEESDTLKTAVRAADGRPSQIKLEAFRFDWDDVARGQLSGTLPLDNQLAGQPVAPDFPAPREALQAPIPLRTVRIADETDERNPLRLAGVLNLEQAEIYGAPATEDSSSEERENGATTAAGSQSNLERGMLAHLPGAPAFNVDLVIGRNVQFISSNLRATITGEIEFGGVPNDPIVSGTLFTRAGNITFPNARARLESGEITITARRDPVTDILRLRAEIDATARGRTGRYEITLRVRGPLDTGERSTQALRVDVSSNPPLSSDQAFARLLGTAALNRGDAGGQEEAYARALVGFLSGPLFSGLERSLERTLGLDSIALDYRVDEPIGIEVGKAIGDRLYLSYRRALSRGSNEKTPFDLRIEYRIKGNFQIGIESDETDTHRIILRKSWRF